MGWIDGYDMGYTTDPYIHVHIYSGAGSATTIITSTAAPCNQRPRPPTGGHGGCGCSRAAGRRGGARGYVDESWHAHIYRPPAADPLYTINLQSPVSPSRSPSAGPVPVASPPPPLQRALEASPRPCTDGSTHRSHHLRRRSGKRRKGAVIARRRRRQQGSQHHWAGQAWVPRRRWR